MYNKARGYALERRVKLLFEAAGYGARRSPFSRTPDIIVSRGDTVILGLECKKRTQRDNAPIYIPEKQMGLLLSFCARHSIRPYIVFSFYREEPKIIEPGKLRKTRSGSFVLEGDDWAVGLGEFITSICGGRALI